MFRFERFMSDREQTLELPGMPAWNPSTEMVGSPLDHAHYIAECQKRWHGATMSDARANWLHFEEMKGSLLEAMRTYKRNPMLQDLSGKYHNPDGSLTSLLWKMQDAWQPDQSCLFPLLDFCDHYQKIFLRRGLIIYCSMLLRQMEANADSINRPK